MSVPISPTIFIRLVCRIYTLSSVWFPAYIARKLFFWLYSSLHSLRLQTGMTQCQSSACMKGECWCQIRNVASKSSQQQLHAGKNTVVEETEDCVHTLVNVRFLNTPYPFLNSFLYALFVWAPPYIVVSVLILNTCYSILSKLSVLCIMHYVPLVVFCSFWSRRCLV